jgi:hypothetical protein
MSDTAYRFAIRTDWSGRANSQRAGAVVAKSLRASWQEALGFQFNGDLWHLQGATTEGLTASPPSPRRVPGAPCSPAAAALTYDASANNDFTDNTYYVADTLKKVGHGAPTRSPGVMATT